MGRAEEKFITAQLAVLEQIATAAPMEEVLTSVVQLIERQSEGMLCSILLLDEAQRHLGHAAGPSLPREFMEAIDGSEIGPDRGSCGAAAFSRERVVTADIATHPNWERFRQFALPHGLRGAWSAPIQARDGEVLGTFAMYYREPRGPTQQELDWVAAATHLASVAILRERAEQSLRHSERRAQQLARLYAVSSSVSEAIVRCREPERLYELACRIAVERGLAALAWVGAYDAERDLIEPLARFGNDDGYIDSIVLGMRSREGNRGPGAQSLRTGKVSLSNDVANDPDFYWREEALRRGLRSCAVFPLRLSGGAPGVFVLYGASTDFFHAEEVSVLTTMAEDISFAVESAEIESERKRLEQALREREERLQLLHDLGEATRKLSGVEEMLPVALRLLGEHLRVTRCTYATVGPDQDLCVIPYDYTSGCPSMVGSYRLSDQSPELVEAFRRGDAPLVVRNVWKDLPEHTARLWADWGIQAFVTCSLVRQGTLRAIMAVHQERPRDWTASEVAIVQEIVERCWAMIEQRAAEANLRRNEALLRIAGAAARLGGWSLDVPTRRLVWSDEACAIYGVPPGTVPSHEQAAAFTVSEFRAVGRTALEACIRDGTAFDMEFQIVNAAGQRKWLRGIGQAERNSAGEVTRVQGAVQDIDERRKLEEHLRQSHKLEAIGQLAGGIAHDFNNLLSVILSYSSVMIDSLPPGDPMRADLLEIKAAGERAGELTRRLLAFSRQQVQRARVIDLNQVVAGSERLLRRLIGAQVTLTVAIADQPAQVLSDTVQLEQVIMNLVVNARDAMPNGGSVKLQTALADLLDPHEAAEHDVPPARYVVLSVADTGGGMDAATQARIFEPFFTTKEKGKGTGLGLSTVYGIVSQASGHIRVRSEPGAGSVFNIYFPEHGPCAAQADVQPAHLGRLGGTETILVVEDVDQVRALIRSVLQRAGYEVLEAQNAGEALLLCEQHAGPIHLLLTDVVLPRMSGQKLAARLRPARPEMRVLYTSGYTNDALVQQGVLDRGVAFLTKPITPDALLRRTREVLDAEAAPSSRFDIGPRRPSIMARNGEHILHVDDEAALVQLTGRILKRLGYRVSGFTNPEQALLSFRTHPSDFSAVISDLTMPGMSGMELVRQIRTTRADIPVVLTSGHFREEDIHEAERMQIQALVLKPESLEELGRVLRDVITV